MLYNGHEGTNSIFYIYFRAFLPQIDWLILISCEPYGQFYLSNYHRLSWFFSQIQVKMFYKIWLSDEQLGPGIFWFDLLGIGHFGLMVIRLGLIRLKSPRQNTSRLNPLISLNNPHDHTIEIKTYEIDQWNLRIFIGSDCMWLWGS